MTKLPAKGAPNITICQVFSYLLSGRGNHSKKMFYARILSQLKRYEEPGLGTMAVTIRDGGYALLYDPEVFQGKYTLDQLAIIVMHEALHLALMHIPRFVRFMSRASSEEQARRFRAMSNIAMDYAVNSLIIYSREYSIEQMRELQGLIPEDAGLPPYKSMDWYLLEIAKKPDEIANRLVLKGAVPPPPDTKMVPSDEEADEGSGGPPPKQELKSPEEVTTEILENYARSVETGSADLPKEEGSSAGHEDLEEDLKRASQKIVASDKDFIKGRGIIPQSILSALQEALADPVLPWERILRRHISTSRKTKKRRHTLTRKRRVAIDELNPQDIPCEYPGHKKDPSYRIVFAIDTSGSMSDGDVAKAISELQGVQRADSGIRITVLEADTRIQREYEIGHKDPIKRDRAGRGGTRFDPVFQRYKELSADLLIYASDGEAPLPEHANRIPEKEVLWLITEGGVYPGSWYYSEIKETYGKAIFIK